MTDPTADLKATPETPAPDAATNPDLVADAKADKPADAPKAEQPADKPDDEPADVKPDVKADTKADPVKDAKADQPAFPDNWREMLAGDNKALLNTLKRYASPKSWTDAAFALRQKISSGELKSALPKDATDEQIAEWRKDNGIPDTPDKYDTALPDGLVIGEQDKPMVDRFLTEMHATHATPDQVKSALTAYYKIQQDMIRETQEADGGFKTQTEDALRTEWGGEFRKNINMVTGVLDTLPEEVADRIAFARTTDGRKLGDDPGFLKAMAQWARDMGIDSGAIIPGGNAADAIKTLQTEMDGLKKIMGSAQYGQPQRERYAELVDILNKQKARAA